MPESSPPFAPPSCTSLPGRRGQPTPPQPLNSPFPETPASPGLGALGQVLLIPTALGMTHYSVSRGRIRPEICVPGVHLALSQLPSFLPSLSNPTRVLQTPSRSLPFLPSPGKAPLLHYLQNPFRVFLEPVSPPPLPVPKPGSSTTPSLSRFFHRDKSGAKGRKVHSGFSDRPPVRLGRLRRPVPGGGSGPGFARARRPPPGAGAPGRGASRRLVIAGARRPLGPRVLRCPRARPGAPPHPATPGARRRRARLQPRPPPNKLRAARPLPEPPVATAGSPTRRRGSCRLCGAPAPPSAEEAPANGAAWAPERRRRAAGGCRGSLAARLTPRLPPSEGAGKSPGRTRAASVGAAELRGRCGQLLAPPRGAL